MEGEFFFKATPIAPPGSAMLMQVKPGERASWQHNAKKAWYVGPCLKHWRSFKGALPTTKGERISDSVRFQHHAIAIPSLTPADRILEATRQLKDAIEMQPKRHPSDELRAIKMLREVMRGERQAPLPLNSVQQRNINHKKQLQKEKEGEKENNTPPRPLHPGRRGRGRRAGESSKAATQPTHPQPAGGGT